MRQKQGWRVSVYHDFKSQLKDELSGLTLGAAGIAFCLLQYQVYITILTLHTYITHCSTSALLHLSTSSIPLNLWWFWNSVTWAKVFPLPQKQALMRIHQTKTQSGGNHHVYLESNSYHNMSLFSVSPSKTRKGRRENGIDNPWMAGLRVGLMQGKGNISDVTWTARTIRAVHTVLRLCVVLRNQFVGF